ncbi:MAG: CTP synthase [Candidatus Yanofskybacteria bacterium RIFCSPHIGHO2_02_FULL_44_12b]|uniref:CTP synthase n=2 Tax=Candidatus Yanofskyibacteriota TaxID=1752733 RepID=A0A1F8GNL0_9BACT|nr:MAG: CTP synthase [Candidatus Yanofskybacteria bacterium RIFCSPHIGHO2_01_FULL_44_24]OGN15268.1 MAG: CTP synthase [Candidatus Yanofskybacteria bacterium RIFCSPHIGHO2_02_FULL_44_12b]OGN26931.1 MAG: CTP synthase [Candidatus Yanofskybacteria bacterium RIFCSPLOWO2_01_FULL_44_22]
MKTNFIFVCGGVMSGIGKGVTVASTARILKDYGFRVTAVKIDPYLNVDAGTMNPTEHGEVFVTDDGMECDQDIGNYERFLGENILRDNYMTSGLVYKSVIDQERNLKYGGKCVQVIPDITNEVERRLWNVARKTDADFVLVEIGGTVGEYENLIFLETARIMKLRSYGQVIFMLVSYFPIPKMIGEMKTKPTQHAVRAMNSAGIQPDFIIARSSRPLDSIRKQKVSIFCNVAVQDVISAPDIDGSVYEIPVNFEKDNLGRRILEKTGLKSRTRKSKQWDKLIGNIRASKEPVKIGIVGKYFGSGDFTLADSYISVIEAIKHAAWSIKRKPEITWLESEQYEKNPQSVRELKNFHGIIVPGGFGKRGVEGKINAIKYVRENNIPFLGLCYGLQLSVVEFARNICKMAGAHTAEVDQKTPEPVICTMPDQLVNIKEKRMGGSMRLGAYKCKLAKHSLARKLYGKDIISERHRHRYEVNNQYRGGLEKKGLLIAGVNPQRGLVEVIELPKNKFFVATQFHPELTSRPLNPHPLFRGLLKAAAGK